MKEYYINVSFENDTIDSDFNNLVQNDYCLTKINFQIDKEYNRALFEIKYQDGSIYQTEIKDNSIILSKGILYQAGTHEFEISVYNNEGKLTHYHTKEFKVREKLVNSDEIIVLDDRLPILDTLIGDVESFKNEIKNDESLRGPEGKPGKTYDDTEIKKRLAKLEDTLFLKATANVSINNDVITLMIKSNKTLQEMEGFTLSNDKKSLSKILSENIGGEITITSIDGQELTLTYEAAPEVTISISNQNEDGTTNKTNQPVTVTLTSNKEVQQIKEWNISEDKKILTKTFYEVKANNLTIYDLAGNSINLKFNVTNVDTIAPKILKIESSDNSDGSYTIKITTSEIVALGNRNWTYSGTYARLFKKNFTMENLTDGVEEVLMLIDKYDNKAYEKINVSLVDNEVVATHEIIEHLEHECSENIEVYEATANNTHNHIVKQVCNICKYENIISSTSEACTDSELQNLETDEEHCYIHVKTCTKCNQEIYRDAPEHHESSTCDSVGDIHCTECGKVLRNIGPVLPPLPPLCIHDEYDSGVTAETACSANLINKTCDICGETYQVKGTHIEGAMNPASGEVRCRKCAKLLRVELIDDDDLV